MLATQIALKNGLGTIGIALLGVERCSRHVRDHGITTTKGVLGSSEGVTALSWLGEPDITTISGKVARLEGGGNVFFDDNSTAGSVDEIRACDWC